MEVILNSRLHPDFARKLTVVGKMTIKTVSSQAAFEDASVPAKGIAFKFFMMNQLCESPAAIEVLDKKKMKKLASSFENLLKNYNYRHCYVICTIDNKFPAFFTDFQFMMDKLCKEKSKLTILPVYNLIQQIAAMKKCIEIEDETINNIPPENNEKNKNRPASSSSNCSNSSKEAQSMMEYKNDLLQFVQQHDSQAQEVEKYCHSILGTIPGLNSIDVDYISLKYDFASAVVNALESPAQFSETTNKRCLNAFNTFFREIE